VQYNNLHPAIRNIHSQFTSTQNVTKKKKLCSKDGLDGDGEYVHLYIGGPPILGCPGIPPLMTGIGAGPLGGTP